MLSRDNNGVDLLRLDGAVGLLQVLNGDLGLAVRAEPPELSALAHVRENLAKTSSHRVRQRHAVGGLIASVAEHDALVASANVHLVLADVNTASDVRALLV